MSRTVFKVSRSLLQNIYPTLFKRAAIVQWKTLVRQWSCFYWISQRYYENSSSSDQSIVPRVHNKWGWVSFNGRSRRHRLFCCFIIIVYSRTWYLNELSSSWKSRCTCRWHFSPSSASYRWGWSAAISLSGRKWRLRKRYQSWRVITTVTGSNYSVFFVTQQMILAMDVVLLPFLCLLLFSTFRFYTKGNFIIIGTEMTNLSGVHYSDADETICILHVPARLRQLSASAQVPIHVTSAINTVNIRETRHVSARIAPSQSLMSTVRRF